MAASINCAKRRKAKPARYGNGASVSEIDRILTDPRLASVVPRRSSRRASIDSRNGESVDNTVLGNLVVEMRKQTDMVSNLITLVTALVNKLGGGDNILSAGRGNGNSVNANNGDATMDAGTTNNDTRLTAIENAVKNIGDSVQKLLTGQTNSNQANVTPPTNITGQQTPQYSRVLQGSSQPHSSSTGTVRGQYQANVGAAAPSSGSGMRNQYYGQGRNNFTNADLDSMRVKCRTNVIIFRLPEMDCEHDHMQKLADKQEVENILDALNLSHLKANFRHSIRLGQKGDGITRPLKVIFLSEENREEVMDKAKELRSVEGYRTQGFINRDMIREDRMRLKREFEIRRNNRNLDWDVHITGSNNNSQGANAGGRQVASQGTTTTPPQNVITVENSQVGNQGAVESPPQGDSVRPRQIGEASGLPQEANSHQPPPQEENTPATADNSPHPQLEETQSGT